MSLRPFRQLKEINLSYVSPWTQERGGLLSFGSASGITIVEYTADPSGSLPVGIQLNDIVNVNFSRQIHPQHLRTVEIPLGTVGIGMEGDFETDWVHLVGSVNPGDIAYVGPSGTFTNSSTFGGFKVGRFLSTLEADPHTVIWRGMGFSRQFMDPATKEIIWENNPDDAILIATPGYIRVRLNQRDMRRSQAGL